MLGGPDDLDRLPKMSSCAALDNVPVADRRMIRMPRVRFTLWQMMIAVAIFAGLMAPATWLSMAMITTIQAGIFRRRAEHLGGPVVLQVVRPAVKQLVTFGFLLYAVALMALLGYLVLDMRTTAAGSPASYLVNEAVDILLPCACFGVSLYWACVRSMRLEFRERRRDL